MLNNLYINYLNDYRNLMHNEKKKKKILKNGEGSIIYEMMKVTYVSKIFLMI